MADTATPTSLDWHRLKSPWTVIILIAALVAVFDAAQWGAVMTFAVKALVNTAPYILFAVGLVAYLKASGAEAMIAEIFKGNEVRMIFMAAIFGGLAPFCSCEVIPFIAGLLALGAPLSAVMAFWLSSPLLDPPTFLITAGALGWDFAIGKAVSAVAVGIAGGFIMKAVASRFSDPLRPRQTKGCGCGPSLADRKPVWKIWQDRQRMAAFGTETRINGLFLLKWLALAYMLEALLVFYVPAEMIAQVVGGQGIGGIIVAAAVGMPAYLNGYIAPPLLNGLMDQGMTAGAAMAFMVAGAISSIPAMAAVWSLVRAPVFLLYAALGFFGAVTSGLIFQLAV